LPRSLEYSATAGLLPVATGRAQQRPGKPSRRAPHCHDRNALAGPYKGRTCDEIALGGIHSVYPNSLFSKESSLHQIHH
jgi:hypothetical protein